MKTAWPKLLFLLVLFPVSAAVARDQVYVTATLHDSSHTITGRMTSVISNLTPGLTELHFRLYPNRFCDSAGLANDECGLIVDSLLVNGADRMREATVRATDLSIPIDYEGLTDQELAIESYFTLKLPPNKSRFGYHHGQYALEAWLPVLAPRTDSGWLIVDYSSPTVEPVGDPVDFDVTLTVPSRLSVIAPGIVDSVRSDSLSAYRIVLPDVAHVPVVIAADMLIDQVATGGVTQTVFFRAEHKYAVDSIQRWIAFTLDHMSNHVYPYPHDELLVVIGALPGGGGLEHPRMIWLSDLFSVAPAYSPRMVVVHEVIHQWFYYLVNSNQAAEPWLDEAVTEYFTMRVLAAMTEGTGVLIDYYGIWATHDVQHRVSARRMFGYGRLDQPAASIRETDLYSQIYAKGSSLISTLVAQMGEREDLFWQTYVNRYLYQRPSAESFYRLAESFTRGSRTGRVEALLTTLNRPDYSVSDITALKLPAGSDLVGTNAIEYESTIQIAVISAIPFPVDVRLIMADETVVDTVIEFQTGRHTLVRRSTQPVSGVVIDPDLRVKIDDNFLNNSLFTSPVNSASQRILSVLTFLVESLYSILWGI